MFHFHPDFPNYRENRNVIRKTTHAYTIGNAFGKHATFEIWNTISGRNVIDGQKI